MNRLPQEFEDHPLGYYPPVFRAVVKHVTDGDTLDLYVDLGFNAYRYITVRLDGIDTPEIWRPKDEDELRRGREAKAVVQELVLGKPVRITTTPGTSFGRYHAKVAFPHREGDGPLVWIDLAQRLRDLGFDDSEEEA